jgi:hypothetical protein
MGLALIWCLYNLRIRHLKNTTALALSAVFICYFLVNSLLINYPNGYDFGIFHTAGLSFWEGRNPYADTGMVSPPTSLPLFALFSFVDSKTSLAVWTIINLVLSLCLIPLAWLCLFSVRWVNTKALTEEIAPLASFFILSLPVLWGIRLGQLAILEAFLLITAFVLSERQRQFGAGVFLALATLKPQTLIPFLLNFLRKDAFKTLLGLCLTVSILLVAMRSIPHVFAALQDEMRNIASLSAPGGVNDFSFEAPYHHTIIGLNYLLYCLGFRDRMLIQVITVGATLALGVVLLLAVLGKRWHSGARLSLVCVYALLFFYHRFHDAVILAVPLTYSYVMALRSTGRQQSVHLLAFFVLIPVLAVHPTAVVSIVNAIPLSMPIARRLAEAFLLPYATWSALIAMVLIWLGARPLHVRAQGGLVPQNQTAQ